MRAVSAGSRSMKSPPLQRLQKAHEDIPVVARPDVIRIDGCELPVRDEICGGSQIAVNPAPSLHS